MKPTKPTEPTRSISLPDFLTDDQIAQAVKLYEAHGMDAVGKIRSQVIEPNMATINAKLGQEKRASYLAYAVVYTFSQVEEQRWS